MWFFGEFVGGFIPVLLLSVVWERFAFQKVFDNPVKGKLASVVTAWLTASTIAGWGMADGGPYAWGAFGIYGLPAVLLIVLAYFKGKSLREQNDYADGY